MPNLTQLGTNGPFISSMYSIVVFTDDEGQVWIHNHTDKTRSYKTDWDAKKVAEAIDGTKTMQQKITEARAQGTNEGARSLKYRHNQLPWYKRIQKKE